jgi:hypothetical protein
MFWVVFCLALTGADLLFAQPVEVEKLLAFDGDMGDHFGISVSLDGNRALVGAYLDGDRGGASGSARIF